MPLAARDLRTIQSATNFHLNSLGAKPQRLFNGFAHSAPKRNAFFELRGNFFCLELGVEFRFVNLLNRDQNFATGLGRQVSLQLVDLRALAADDDSRPGSVDHNLQPVGGSLNVDMRNAGAGKTLFEVAL